MVSLFSICNIHYLPVFTTVGFCFFLFALLDMGEQTVTLWTAIEFYVWRDALVTVINRRKLTDAQANPSTQRKRYLSPIWQITLYFIRQEQLYVLLKNKRKETYIKSNTPHK